MSISRRGLKIRSGATLVALVLVLAGCSDGGDDAAPSGTTAPTTAPTTEAPSTGSTIPPGADAVPQESLRAAVDVFLAARVANDIAGSYRVLGGPVLDEYRDLAEWEMRLSELSPPTGYEIVDGGDPALVVATVTHEPGLDPFIGLSAAEEKQTFTGVEVDGGWLIDAEPEVEIVFPADEAATSAVTDWATAVQACDEPAADALQGISTIFGQSVGAGELCKSTGAIEAGAPERLLGGPESADLIAQYSTDAIAWARAVPVTAPVTPFFVIVAPIGEGWKVIGVYD